MLSQEVVSSGFCTVELLEKILLFHNLVKNIAYDLHHRPQNSPPLNTLYTAQIPIIS